MDHEYKEPYKLKLKKLDLEKQKEFHQISCPSCQAGIPASDLNINDKIAKCNSCNVVFSFQGTVNQLFTNAPKIKQEVIRPEGIDLFYFKEDLDITIQQPYSVLEGIVGGIGIMFALLFTFIAFLKPGLFPMIGTIGFWLISAYPIYSWSTHSKNKIYVNIDERFINIEWRPKKMNKDKKYAIQDIDQLFIKKNPNTGYYDLHMIVNGIEGQKHMRLIPGLDSQTKARYLEQELERHLGIIDREVLEETKF